MVRDNDLLEQTGEDQEGGARRVHPAGIEKLLPTHPCLGDVTTAEELAEYQTQKRAHKAAMRAQSADATTKRARS